MELQSHNHAEEAMENPQTTRKSKKSAESTEATEKGTVHKRSAGATETRPVRGGHETMDRLREPQSHGRSADGQSVVPMSHGQITEATVGPRKPQSNGRTTEPWKVCLCHRATAGPRGATEPGRIVWPQAHGWRKPQPVREEHRATAGPRKHGQSTGATEPLSARRPCREP